MVNMSMVLEFGSVAYRVCVAPFARFQDFQLPSEPNRDQAGTVQGIECLSNSQISITDEYTHRKKIKKQK